MSDSEFNAQQRRATVKRNGGTFRIPERSRPEGVGYQEHKNRYLVSAKLTPTNWDVLRAWLVSNNLNYNTGLNRLIATHPELEQHG